MKEKNVDRFANIAQQFQRGSTPRSFCHSCSKVSTAVNFAIVITRRMINAPRTKERTEKASLFVAVFAAVLIYR